MPDTGEEEKTGSLKVKASKEPYAFHVTKTTGDTKNEA
jgi:hypothetical protein